MLLLHSCFQAQLSCPLPARLSLICPLCLPDSAQQSVLGKYMVLSCATPSEVPAFPFLQSSLSFSHSFLTLGRAWALLADSAPALVNTHSSRQWLGTQPHVPAAPSFPFPFPSGLSKLCFHLCVCSQEQSCLLVTRISSQPFLVWRSLHLIAFPLAVLSSTALLLSSGFVSCTLLIILVLQEQIPFMFSLLTKH